MATAWLIDTERRQIVPVNHFNFRDIQAHLKCDTFTHVTAFPNGDVLLIDDEGMFKPQRFFFSFRGVNQPLAGHGIVIGPDVWEDEKERSASGNVLTSKEDLQLMVHWLTRADADAWARANADRPSSSMTAMNADGKSETVVFQTYGELFSEMPKAEEDN